MLSRKRGPREITTPYPPIPLPPNSTPSPCTYKLSFNGKQLSRYYTDHQMAVRAAREYPGTLVSRIDIQPVLDLTHTIYTAQEVLIYDGELSSTRLVSVVQPATIDGVIDEFVLFRIHLYSTDAMHVVKARIEEMLLVHTDLQVKVEMGYIKKREIELDDPEYIEIVMGVLGYMLYRRKPLIK